MDREGLVIAAIVKSTGIPRTMMNPNVMKHYSSSFGFSDKDL